MPNRKAGGGSSVANLTLPLAALPASAMIFSFSVEEVPMAGKERFHGGHFPKCIVLQSVFWYLRYSLSYLDIEELMEERGVELDHATVQRRVVKYTPLLEVEFRKKRKLLAPAGEWMRPTSRSKVNGAICIEPLTKKAKPLTSC